MKRGKKLIILLIALIVLAGGYYAVTLLTKEPQVSENTGEYAVSEVTADNLSAMTWTYNDETVSLKKDGDTWVSAADAAYPVDQDAAQALADTIVNLKGTREITGDAALSDYGLEEPAFTLTVTTTDGKECTYQMGDSTLLTSEYYLKTSDHDAIYTVGTSIKSKFSKGMNELAVMETLPEFGDITHVSTAQLDQTLDADTTRWARTGTKEISDTSKVEAVLTAVKAITWDSLAAYAPTEEQLAQFGLDKPDTLAAEWTSDGAQHVFTLEIGAQNDDGNYYARLKDSSMVYLITSDTLSAVLTATNDTVRDMTLTAISWDDVEKIAFTLNGETHEILRTVMESQATAAPDAEATALPENVTAAPSATPETIQTETATLDGGDADVTAVKAFYTDLAAQKGNGAAADGTNNAAQVFSVTVTAKDGTQNTLTFQTYNASSYIVQSDCERKLTVAADGIDRLVREAKALLP